MRDPVEIGGSFLPVSKLKPSSEQRPLVSLNIDVANLPREAIERLVELAPAQGRVVISHAFGDFRREDMDELAVQLYLYGFRLIHCPAWPNQRGRLKSVVDDVMAQDLRDQMEYAPEVEVFILGSGDRNFIAVANALKRHGKRVVVAADQESINRELRLCADEYLALPRGRGGRFVPALPEPDVDFETPSGIELLEQVRHLAESSDYLTVRRVVRAILPDEVTGIERARSSLASRLQELIDAGHIRSERRTVRGRVMNTLVIVDDDGTTSADEREPTAEGIEVQEPVAPSRRRARRRASAPAAP